MHCEIILHDKSVNSDEFNVWIKWTRIVYTTLATKISWTPYRPQQSSMPDWWGGTGVDFSILLCLTSDDGEEALVLFSILLCLTMVSSMV